jgi:hypothetical protein
MPKTLATQSVITINARPLTLCRPVRPDFAQRLAVQHPRLIALNAAGKTQKDAAEALGISVPLLRNWLELLGIKWTNVQPRAPYSTR